MVTAKVDSPTGQIDFDDNGAGGGTRVVGIYEDPLIAEGRYGGFLSDGTTCARKLEYLMQIDML